MRTKVPYVVIAAAMAFVASPARAQTQPQGAPYVGAHLGLAIFHNSDIKPEGTATVKAAWKSGFAFGLDVGYKFTENVRVEGEVSYKKNDVDTIAGQAVTSGDLTAWGFMANAYYDFTQAKMPVTPFAGVGLGAVRGKVSSPSVANGGLGDQTDTEFGYQLTLGFSYALSPQASLYACYRYQGSSDLSFTVSDPAAGVPPTKVKISYGASNILAGLNYSF